jgi:hypothetical protein
VDHVAGALCCAALLSQVPAQFVAVMSVSFFLLTASTTMISIWCGAPPPARCSLR